MNVLAIASVAVIAIGGSAYAQDTSDRDFLVSYLEGNKCIAAMTDIREAFEGAGRSWSLSEPTALGLIEAGDAAFLAPLEAPENQGSRVALQSGNICSNFEVTFPTLDPALVMSFVKIFETNGCAIQDEENTWEQLQEVYSKQDISNFLIHFMNKGQLEFSGASSGRISFTGSELCSG